MLRIVKISVFLVVIQNFIADYKHFVNSQSSLEELELAQDMILDDIRAIRRKVWINVATDFRTLEKKIENVEKRCLRDGSQQEGNKTYTSSGENASWNSLNKHDNALNLLLLKGLKEEKMKTRQLEETLKQSINDITDMRSVLNEYKTITDKLSADLSLTEQKLIMATQDSENLRQNVLTLQKVQDNLSQDLNLVNVSVHSKQDKTKYMIHKPTFISEWILMRAQDIKFADRTVPHGLGTLPYKVDVQIRPTSGPNAGWIFSGDSAIQSDDDIPGEVYGGVVYFYDETNVYIEVPVKNNGRDLGVTINTGEANNRRLGNNHQTSLEAYVRVKAWAPSDFPEPDMKSDWLPLDITNKSQTFYELTHGFNDYPGLLNIQIRRRSNGRSLISEGLGATLIDRPYSGAGGVVHAFNENVTRIWAGYVSNTTGNYHYRLLGNTDGWGHSIIRSISAIKGHFRVLAWSQFKVTDKSQDFEKHEENHEFAEWSVFKKFSPDFDLFSFYVQANDGVNKGFRFPGYGNSQSIDSPFGGAVYAYSPNGDVRIWRPNPAVNGYLVHVHDPYGNGAYAQASNDAHYVSTLLRSS